MYLATLLPHTVATLRDCPREDWLATHEDWLATGISSSFWRLQKTEHVRSSVPPVEEIAKSLDFFVKFDLIWSRVCAAVSREH